jgi:oligogalacturonide lyase
MWGSQYWLRQPFGRLPGRSVFPFSRREFLFMAAVGRITGPELHRYADPATELTVVRLTDPAFASGMTAPPLRQFTRHSETLLYWSERAGTRQAFLLDLKQGDSKQITDAADLDPGSLSLSPDERSFFWFDGPVLNESPLANTRPREIHRVPEDAVRVGMAVGSDGSLLFVERRSGRSRIVGAPRNRTIVDLDGEIEGIITARPRHQQVLYRTGGALWLVNTDGSGNRRLKTAAGQTGEAFWIPSGRTLLYLHVPEDAAELITLREHTPEDGGDKLLAKTSQFISVAPNADASVFTGASRNKGSAYVLILLRAAQRELTLCEHRASDPRMVNPLFSPDSQNVLFVSDRDGKPAIYLIPVARFVEETSAETP